MSQTDHPEQFIRNITESQNRLYGYVYSLVGDHDRAAEVLQETNLVLWRRSSEFIADRPFLPWAFGIARNQILASIRDQNRNRLLLDADLVESLADQAESRASQFDSMQGALRNCLQKLTPNNRQLVELRYLGLKSLNSVADEVGRSVGAVKVAMVKIRKQLGECIESNLARENH